MSAFAFGGLPQRAVKEVVTTANLYVSPELLAEYREVPETLLVEEKVTSGQRQALVAGIASVVARATVVYPKKDVAVCRDPKDDMVLACCLTARADVLITGDKDLLALDADKLRHVGLGQLRIVNPRTYLAVTV